MMIVEPGRPFKLSAAEQTSPVWARLRKHYEERLQKARIRNDDQSLNEVETAKVRALISEAKYFLSLDKELPFQEL